MKHKFLKTMLVSEAITAATALTALAGFVETPQGVKYQWGDGNYCVNNRVLWLYPKLCQAGTQPGLDLGGKSLDALLPLKDNKAPGLHDGSCRCLGAKAQEFVDGIFGNRPVLRHAENTQYFSARSLSLCK